MNATDNHTDGGTSPSQSTTKNEKLHDTITSLSTQASTLIAQVRQRKIFWGEFLPTEPEFDATRLENARRLLLSDQEIALVLYQLSVNLAETLDQGWQLLKVEHARAQKEMKVVEEKVKMADDKLKMTEGIIEQNKAIKEVVTSLQNTAHDQETLLKDSVSALQKSASDFVDQSARIAAQENEIEQLIARNKELEEENNLLKTGNGEKKD